MDGQRVRYFQDDDAVGLQEMVRREKMSSAQDQNALYSRMAAKVRKSHNLTAAGLKLTSELFFFTTLQLKPKFLRLLRHSQFRNVCIRWS